LCLHVVHILRTLQKKEKIEDKITTEKTTEIRTERKQNETEAVNTRNAKKDRK
jgi:hypothetical protein